MTLPELQAKLVAFAGKIESAQLRVDECRQELAHNYLEDESNVPRLQADVMAAQHTLDALLVAKETLTEKVKEAEVLALDEEIEARRKKIETKSKARKVSLNKAEEYLQLTLAEIEKADNALSDIRNLSQLPNIGAMPEAWVTLKLALKDTTGPLAISMAGTIGLSNPRLAEDLGRALSHYKTAVMQAKGRSLSEMGLDAGSIIAA